MRKIRLTESDLVRLVKRVISENPVPTTIIRNLLRGGFLTNAVNALDELLVLRQIDDTISPGTGASSIRITNGNQVLDHYLNNRLKPADQQTVFNQIFKTSTDDQLILELSRWLIRQDNFINTYRNATPNQVYRALEPEYGARQARIIADEFRPPINPFNPYIQNYPYPEVTPNQAKNVFEALKKMYALDKKALKIIEDGKAILERINKSDPEEYQASLYQNQQIINAQLSKLGWKKEMIDLLWKEVKTNPTSKFVIRLTFGILFMIAASFIYRMFDINGISTIGMGLEMIFGEQITDNAKKYGCELGIKPMCSGSGPTPPDPGDLPDII